MLGGTVFAGPTAFWLRLSWSATLGTATAIDRAFFRARDLGAARTGGLTRLRPSCQSVLALGFADRSFDTVTALEAGQRNGSVRPGDPVAMTAALHGAILVGVLGRTVYERTTGGRYAEDWEAEVARSALDGVAARR